MIAITFTRASDYLSVGSLWQNIGFYAILIVLACMLTNQFVLLKARNGKRQKNL
ncbi:hypothetical protein [Mucilaginibacter ginsenosidivorax]|uniref:hypothetical protein n=1 Tax=Mucilaginibacter ginsenosidivorax TaxID=862126 RepID=UPI001315A907|nr:hypothetical protein [Mucilaginibacter ginsenosidivorax]